MPGDTGRGFKIVVGRGTAVIPGFQTVRRFYLGLRTTTLTVKAPSNQSIPLTVKGVVVFKVADDKSSIANAARRFLEQTEDVLVGTIHELFAGHLRAIVGGLSVEDMLHNRESLTSAIRVLAGRRPRQAGPDRGLAADPGDRRRGRLHQQPRQAAGRRDRGGGPHRRRAARPGGHRGRAGRRRPQGGGRPAVPDRAGRRTRPRSTRRRPSRRRPAR